MRARVLPRISQWRFALCSVLLAGLSLLWSAAPAGAALEKFGVRNSILWFGSNTSPTRFFAPIRGPDGVARVGPALIDQSGAAPVLNRLVLDIDRDGTVTVPGLSGFIFLSRKYTEGPADLQTGISGDTSSQIDWGTVTGWTITGRNWCNSEPATVCLIGGDIDESTGPSGASSVFYDIGTWIFHGTGFTAVPFIYTRFTTSSPGGNVQYILRGSLNVDGTVPAIPLVGVAVIGGGVLLAGLTAARR